MFFQVEFQKLESNIDRLRKNNRVIKAKIQTKREQLKAIHRQNIVFSLVSQEPSSKGFTTKESSVRLSYSISSKKRIKTDSSLPQLKPYKNQRIKTEHSQYENSPMIREKGRQKSNSYMNPIGMVREKQQSRLSELGSLLAWYRLQVDPDENWFLKVIYNKRQYSKLQKYITENSKERTSYHR